MVSYKILLVEDDAPTLSTLKFALEQEKFEVVGARTVARANMVIESQIIHLILLDVSLPDGDGFKLCKDLRAAGIRQPILFLTGRSQTFDKVRGLSLGADDYLEKPFSNSELVARIKALIRRTYGDLADSTVTVLKFGNLKIDLSQQNASKNGSNLQLTTTEFKLLFFLAQNPNLPISRKQLIKEVWGIPEKKFIGDRRTVDVHIRNLRVKVEENPKFPDRIVTVRGAGYKFAVE